eukprot:gene23714-biopygen23849
MQKLAVLGWHKWGFQLIHVTPPPPGISGRTVPDVVMPQAAQQRARMSSGRQLEVPPFVDAGSLGALLKVASNWWSRQVAGGPVARGCRLEDAGIWRSHRSRRCRQLEVTARGCRQLEVSPLEAAGSWRFQRSWIQTTGGPTARGSRQLEVPPLEVACSGGPAPRDWVGSFGKSSCFLPESPLIFLRLPAHQLDSYCLEESNWASPPVPCPSPFVRKHGLHGRNLQPQTWRSDHGGQARAANFSCEMACTLAPDSKSSSLTPLPHM